MSEPTRQTADDRGAEPTAEFRRRAERASAERDRLSGRARLVSNLRLLAFAVVIGALVWAELRPQLGAVAFSLAALGGLAFFALIAIHSRISAAEARAAERAYVNREALARLRRDWDALPAVPDPSTRGHPYARDLDLFGHGSITRLLSTAGTAVGRARLHDWLLGPASIDEARRRADAVRELVPRLELRQEIQVAGRLAGDAPPAVLERFFDWAESEPWLLRRPWLVWVSRLIPAATIVLGVLHLEGTIDRPWWLITLVIGVAISWFVTRQVHDLFSRASVGDAGLRHYGDLVALIQNSEFDSPALTAARSDLTEECDARSEIDRLAWLTELAALRHSGMFYVLIHWPTLWDLHVLRALEGWQRRAGSHVRSWVRRVAELDALSALAAPPHDEPGWSFPRLIAHEEPASGVGSGAERAPQGDPVAEERPRLEARGLAHPLLPPEERVANDVEVGPPGTFLMVTGSNMSGKSTLLRAIGVNAVLAQAGGPVLAEKMTLPPLSVHTSMRIEDSLERGVSLFMAELQRLKQVVDAADAATAGDMGGEPTAAPPPAVLYLLDEVLHGTNTAERQVAIRQVLSHLLDRRAIGAISTHDLELASVERLESAVVPVHFRETVNPEGEGPAMSFDYALREGVATSTNALKLVRLVGLA